ncbi:phosphotriesterase [Chloroflexota bacterium]
MEKIELAGKVQTVLGLIAPDSLGVTLSHEHLLTDLSAYFIEPTEASEREIAHEPVRMDNLYWVHPHALGHLDNLKLTDENLATKEAILFKQAGGNTIVELSNIGLCRDPLGLARISRSTGLNVVMGAGYYVEVSHPPELAKMTEEEIAEDIVRDIMVGADNTGVRAGIIGEIGCSEPMLEAERKSLRAAVIAQKRTGAAINIHPGFRDDFVLEIVDMLGNAGADLSRVVISHCDIAGLSRDTCHKIMDAGCYLEYDTFGYPGLTPHPNWVTYVPSDSERIKAIVDFIARGYLNQILVASDHCFKHLYVAYGGGGYAYILRDIVPLMRGYGISDEQIHTLLVENPKRLLTFVPVD